MNKSELLKAMAEGRKQLNEAIQGLPEEAYDEPGVVGEWSVKDVLSHLLAWEAELIKLLWQAKNGQKPTSAQVTVKSVDEQNADWFQEMHERPVERVLADFETIRQQSLRRVEGFSDRDLTDPARYPWLKGRPLWQWIAGDTFEHDEEHGEQIRVWRAGRWV